MILSMLSHLISGGLGRLRCLSSSTDRILFCSLPSGHDDLLWPRSEAVMTKMAQIWVEEVLGSWARWEGKKSEFEDLSTSPNVSQHLYSSLRISQRSIVCREGPCSSRRCVGAHALTYLRTDTLTLSLTQTLKYVLTNSLAFILACFLTFDVTMMLTWNLIFGQFHLTYIRNLIWAYFLTFAVVIVFVTYVPFYILFWRVFWDLIWQIMWCMFWHSLPW